MLLLLPAALVSANDSPVGFYYGADGSGPAPTGSGVPYGEPNCGGAYGGYVGRVNDYPDEYFNTTYAQKALDDYNYGYGLGPMAYIDLTGPSDDPDFLGNTDPSGEAAEAEQWGADQASTAAYNFSQQLQDNLGGADVEFDIIFADMEFSNPGWLTSSQYSEYASWNLDVLAGFGLNVPDWPYYAADGNTDYFSSGAYTGPTWWSYTAGTHSYGGYMYDEDMPYDIWEWTADSWVDGDTSSPVTGYWSGYASGECASGWTSGAHYPAAFYGGKSSGSDCVFVWQFIGGDADYDQFDVNRYYDYWNDPCL